MTSKPAKKQEHLAIDDLGDAAIEFFIDLLQKYPSVWNKQLQEYKNNIKKAAAFKAMDEEMRKAGHTSAAGLISTTYLYSLLKKRYQREWSRLHYHPSGSSPLLHKWKFFESLSFLHAHIEDSSRRICTGFEKPGQSSLENEQAGPSSLTQSDYQDYNENVLREYINVENDEYFIMTPSNPITLQPTTSQYSQMSSQRIPASYSSTLKSSQSEDLFAPGWRKRKLKEEEKRKEMFELKAHIEMLKTMKESTSLPKATTAEVTSINQKYVEIWASRLDALPYEAQAKIRRTMEEALFEGEVKHNRF